jgi:acyl-[acyl carrier protein]--UDP-N-acetylglucosamine O-acyltransferase
MTDRSKKITELPAASSVIPADLLLVVKDTTSTPNTHKVTAANLFANVSANTVLNGRVTLANTTTISGSVNLTNTFSVGGTVTIAANGAWVGDSSGLKGEVGSKGDKGDRSL